MIVRRTKGNLFNILALKTVGESVKLVGIFMIKFKKLNAKLKGTLQLIRKEKLYSVGKIN